MRIVVVAPQPVPDTFGGAERATAGLVDHLNRATEHEAELLRLPSPESTLPEVIASYRAFAELDLDDADMVVSLKYPAWMVGHRDHRLLMLHPLRGLYDTYHLFGVPYVVTHIPEIEPLMEVTADPGVRAQLPDLWAAWDAALDALGPDHPAFTFPGPLARRLVHWLDQLALSTHEISRHLTLSSTVAGRPGYLPPGVSPLVAHLPSDLPPVERHDPEHFVTASRLDGPKRIDLLIRALRASSVDVPLLIAGTGPEEARLRELAGGDPRIRFLGFVPDEELADLYARAIAVPFVPLDEDWGLITVEAFNAGTPVITCTDSGGTTELVAHGVTGWVVEPEVAALTAAFEEAVADPDRTTAMGARARTRARLVSWDRVARRLLGPTTPELVTTSGRPASRPSTTGASTSTAASPAPARPTIVVATTFALEPALGGGQIRARNLYAGLTAFADVEVVALAPHGTRPERRELQPGMVETVVPRTSEHHRLDSVSSTRLGVPTGDIMIGAALDHAPAYLEALRRAEEGASAIVLAEPYQLPAVERAGVDLPIVFDAYNLEAELKASVYPPTAEGRELLDRVVAVESAAVQHAALVTACSERDAEELIRRYGRPGQEALVVGNGVDTAAAAFVPLRARRAASRRWRERWAAMADAPVPRALGVFVGSHHPPNVDAAELLVDLALARPDLLVVLCGSHVHALAGHRLPANVVPLGVVSHAMKGQLLATADVAFNPMRVGSGTNLKILEYMAVGVPVLSTPFGARGIEVADGEHMVLAPPDAFAAALDALLAEPEETTVRRVESARQFVEERYDWGVLGRRFAEAVAELIGAEVPAA